MNFKCLGCNKQFEYNKSETLQYFSCNCQYFWQYKIFDNQIYGKVFIDNLRIFVDIDDEDPTIIHARVRDAETFQVICNCYTSDQLMKFFKLKLFR